jgi:hypothetical protein
VVVGTSSNGKMKRSEPVVVGQVQLSLQLFFAMLLLHLLDDLGHDLMTTQLLVGR